MTKQDAMPVTIFATPRGSGTCSGIYVDLALGDEERGEHSYTLTTKLDELQSRYDELERHADKLAYDLTECQRMNKCQINNGEALKEYSAFKVKER